MYEKICKACGKEFQAMRKNYCICSTECREKYAIDYARQYRYHKSTDFHVGLHYEKSKCMICGGTLPNGKYKYCLDCLLTEYKLGKNTYIASQYLYGRGFKAADIWAEIEKRGI